MTSEAKHKSPLRLMDVVYSGVKATISAHFSPIFDWPEHELLISEKLGSWKLRDGLAPHAVAPRASQKNDLVVCDALLKLKASMSADESSAKRIVLYQIEIKVTALYRLQRAASCEEITRELALKTRNHARGVLRNRALEEAACLRLPAIPFHAEWLDLAAKT